MDSKITHYIHKELHKGKSPYTIREKLITIGHKKEDIDKAFHRAQALNLRKEKEHWVNAGLMMGLLILVLLETYMVLL